MTKSLLTVFNKPVLSPSRECDSITINILMNGQTVFTLDVKISLIALEEASVLGQITDYIIGKIASQNCEKNRLDELSNIVKCALIDILCDIEEEWELDEYVIEC